MSSALRAEWTKLVTQRTTVWMLLGSLGAIVGLSAAAGATAHESTFVHGGDATRLSLVGFYLGQIVIATIAVSAISEEHASGMLRTTLSAMPRRHAVLAAKAANVSLLAAIVGLAGVAGCLLIGRLMFPGDGLDPLHGYALVSLGSGSTLRAALGSVLYLVLIAVLALGLGTLIRDTAVSIAAVVGLLFLPPILAQIVGGTLAREIQRLAPMTAGMAVQHTTNLRALPIQPWPGLGILAGWSLAAMLLAGVALQARDV